MFMKLNYLEPYVEVNRFFSTLKLEISKSIATKN